MPRSALTPLDCDFQTEQFLPLCIRPREDRDSVSGVNQEAFRAAVMLIIASWSQVPRASLPNDDSTLSALAGLGRTRQSLAYWLKLRSSVLADWVRGDDDRWYPSKVAEQAVRVWISKEKERCQRLRFAHRRLKTREEAVRL